jgi:hypothetical protein
VSFNSHRLEDHMILCHVSTRPMVLRSIACDRSFVLSTTTDLDLLFAGTAPALRCTIRNSFPVAD